jgi:hypothetical protein
MAKGDSTAGGGYFPNLYQSTVKQTGNDYDSIMQQYKQLQQSQGGINGSNNSNIKLDFSPITPSLATYTPGNTHQDLRDIAQTGGFSESDIGNIRTRATSPINSIYSSAQQGLKRQKALQGGYSPNFGAASAKMARDSSSLASKASSDANASIAEMVQRGKLAASTALAPIDARENEFMNNFNTHNADTTNAANMFNSQGALNYANFNANQDNNDFNNILDTIKGQQSLYGTTPALANTFGSHVLNAANTVNSFPPIRQPIRSGGAGPIRGFGSGAARY